MATQKQRAAARRNVKKAQAGAKSKETLKHLSGRTKTALGKEANKVRKGEAKTRHKRRDGKYQLSQFAHHFPFRGLGSDGRPTRLDQDEAKGPGL